MEVLNDLTLALQHITLFVLKHTYFSFSLDYFFVYSNFCIFQEVF